MASLCASDDGTLVDGIAPEVVQSVMHFLWIWGGHPRRPHASRTDEGGISLEWESQRASLVLTFDPSGLIHADVRIQRCERSGALPQVADDVGEALMLLWVDAA